MNNFLHARVLERVAHQFDVPIIQNNLRGMYVELLVAELLGREWSYRGADWAAYDLEHGSGVRLEVKQSSAKQTWAAPTGGRRDRSFSIRAAKIEWQGGVGIPKHDRAASIYVFAWHGDETLEADQRDPSQWEFYVVPAKSLPDQQTIGLKSLKRIAEPVQSGQLRESVEALLKEGSVQ